MGIDENRWINFGKINVFKTAILPMGDSILYFQEFNSAFALSKTFSKFIFEILFRSVEKVIPKSVNSFSPQSISGLVFILDLEFILLPIQMNVVLSLFTSRPDILPNISKVFKVSCKDFRLPSRITVVSSANCVNLFFTDCNSFDICILIYH